MTRDLNTGRATGNRAERDGAATVRAFMKSEPPGVSRG